MLLFSPRVFCRGGSASTNHVTDIRGFPGTLVKTALQVTEIDSFSDHFGILLTKPILGVAKMRILSTLTSSAVLVLLSSCATRLELSDDVLSIRQNLDRASALEIVASHIVEDSTQKGVCASITYMTGVPDPAKLIELDGSTLIFQGATPEYEGNETTEMGGYQQTRAVYSLHDAKFEMDLTQLAIIEVGVSQPTFMYSCHGFPDGATVKLMADGLKYLWIQVNADREDKLIAALSYLSPEANLRSRR